MKEKNHTILSIIIGASIYDNADNLSSSAFKRAAEGILTYLMSEDGLNIPIDNILWLFDTSYSPNSIDEEMIKFLKAEKTKNATDLIIYYVGHGAIVDDQYYLTIKKTRTDNHGFSSLSFRWLSKTIYKAAKNLRTLWIIDACYAAETKRYYLSDDGIVAKQVGGLYAKAGVSLLCSSPSTRRSVVDERGHLPVFTSFLLKTLEIGIADTTNKKLSARDLLEQVRFDILQSYDDSPPIPEIHSPVQVEGLEVASFALFPNHHGLDYIKRTELEILDVKKRANEKINELETKHAAQEEENNKRKLEQEEADKLKIYHEGLMLEERRRLSKKASEEAAQKELDAAQKRLAGWTEIELREVRDAITNKNIRVEDLKKWLAWQNDRIVNFIKSANLLIEDLKKKKEKVFKPNITYLNNIEYDRKNGEHAKANHYEDYIKRAEDFEIILDKAIKLLNYFIFNIQNNLRYYTTIVNNSNMLSTIVYGLKKINSESFEAWINRGFIDNGNQLILPELNNKIKFWFRSKEIKPSKFKIDECESVLNNYRELKDMDENTHS